LTTELLGIEGYETKIEKEMSFPNDVDFLFFSWKSL
jgi:hypothetical protein